MRLNIGKIYKHNEKVFGPVFLLRTSDFISFVLEDTQNQPSTAERHSQRPVFLLRINDIFSDACLGFSPLRFRQTEQISEGKQDLRQVRYEAESHACHHSQFST